MSPSGAEAQSDQRRRLPPEVRRERLLAAAGSVFAERGYEGARVEQIAEAAGVSPGLLYRHFPGKRELYEELVRVGAEEMMQRAAEAASPEYEGVERLERGIEAFLGFVEENRDMWRMLMRDEPEPGVAVVRDAMYQQVVILVRDLVAQDPEATKLDVPDTELELVAVVIVGSAQAVGTWWNDHPDVPRDELVAGLMNTLWMGLDRLRVGQRYENSGQP